MHFEVAVQVLDGLLLLMIYVLSRGLAVYLIAIFL